MKFQEPDKIEYLEAKIQRHLTDEYPMVPENEFPPFYLHNIREYFIREFSVIDHTRIYPMYQFWSKSEFEGKKP